MSFRGLCDPIGDSFDDYALVLGLSDDVIGVGEMVHRETIAERYGGQARSVLPRVVVVRFATREDHIHVDATMDEASQSVDDLPLRRYHAHIARELVELGLDAGPGMRFGVRMLATQAVELAR